MFSLNTRVLVSVIFLCMVVPVNAALIGRLPSTPGGTDYRAVYDDVLKITWLTNAGLSRNGDWENQLDWIDSLNSANHLGFNDWRLASVSTASRPDVFNCSFGMAQDCADAGNELGYMYNHNMVGLGNNNTADQMVGGVLLTDIKTDYWSGTEYDSDFAWALYFDDGFQRVNIKDVNGYIYGWAVRSGDIAAVPVPAAVWLFGAGLVGLMSVGQRKR